MIWKKKLKKIVIKQKKNMKIHYAQNSSKSSKF